MAKNRTLNDSLIYSLYFAPRGRERILALGEQISLRHLSYHDKLIGIVGDAGSGKSLIVKGMFPGMTLSNDDDGLDPRKMMMMRDLQDYQYENTSYHIDLRFQMAFAQMYQIVDFVRGALKNGRRVIVEHFDLLYPYLKINADILIGVGEEIMVTRPNLFGPVPQDLYDIVYQSLKIRKMAHTAEDLTTLVLMKDYNISFQAMNSDVRSGFVLNFEEKPQADIVQIEKKVNELLNRELEVSYYDENHIKIGEDIIMKCTGPRMHVRNTSDVKKFHLIKQYPYDRQAGLYALVGIVDRDHFELENLNRIAREIEE